ncbi:hypothetical protein [Streptomyces hygroscopicus]|nr:hypothetical protein [Streptomyces hygroscopicus]
MLDGPDQILLEGRPEGDRFTLHDLCRAGAAHHYERSMDLLTVQ